ncbi:hypothetical protein ACN2XU_06700 [Primorskyibacter sp. 2E107]|uniref:hypothetical protein n=1 Tax=Primorskyibacter sp. 2E107 TaxID=3403458 RepID=UPI003AF510A4
MMRSRILGMLAAALALPALAESPTGAEPALRAALMDRVEAYEALMADGQIVASLDFLPPALLAQLAKQAGTDPDGMRQRMTEQFQATIDSRPLWGATFEISRDPATIEHTESGRPYAVMASYSAFPSLGIPEINAPVMALMEDEAWYLVRIESPMHSAMVAQIYPDLRAPLLTMDKTR